MNLETYMAYLTAVIYWLLIVCWSAILIFYRREYPRLKRLHPLLALLLIVLFIDGARTLFESLYFGTWCTAKVGLLPQTWEQILTSPFLMVIPKSFNLIAALIIILVIVRRWFSAMGAEVERAREVSRLKEFQDAVFNAITDLLTVQDREYRLLMVNAAVARAVGKPPEELVGQLCYQILHGRNAPCPNCPVEETLRTGKQAMAELESELLGETLQSWTYPLLDSAGEIRAVIKYAKVVTEEKRLQEQELAVARLKSELVSLASHELRAPLASIKGYTTTLLHDPGRLQPDEEREFLEIINSEAERLNILISELLDMSEVEKGQFRIYRRLVSVEELCERALASARHPGLKHELQLHLPPHLPRVLADPDKIHQVLLNLLSNAIKYSPEGRVVSLQVEVRGEEVEFSVSDQGMGLTEEELSRLFKPFYRAPEATSRNISGTGLGLYICKNIVEAHGGRIWAESRVGQGSVFRFTLPRARETDVSPPSPKDSQGEA
ncbi:MAG TPA: PAS domain-containing sensor histidine kinase [Armatimonadetes bacterium]|nr:PAS domain-containing sensor histidine kinase [Armatimonadota bacterium]